MTLDTRQFRSLLVVACLFCGSALSTSGCTIKPGELGALGFGGDREDDKPLSVAVREALEARPDINTHRIDVSSDEDVVTLAGTVELLIERETAGQVAEQVPGVRLVLNNVYASSD